LVAQRPQHAIAVQAGQHQVQDDQVGATGTRPRQALAAILDDLHPVAFDLEVVTQAIREIGIVFDDENPRHAVAPKSARIGAGPGAAWGWPASGSSSTKRVPIPPAPSSAQPRPPCSATSSRTTDKPIPVPATADPRSRSSRQNRSQMRSRSAAGTPGP